MREEPTYRTFLRDLKVPIGTPTRTRRRRCSSHAPRPKENRIEMPPPRPAGNLLTDLSCKRNSEENRRLSNLIKARIAESFVDNAVEVLE